jgi:hypothetical protein
MELVFQRFGLNPQSHMERWLELPPLDELPKLHEKKYTIGRSERHNPSPEIMKKIVDTLGAHNFCFIGLPHEHERFCSDICQVDTIETKDLYDIAVAIELSEMYVGNQSCCLAIAESLKKPVIQETAVAVPNCTFSRLRKDFFLSFYVDGEVRLLNEKEWGDSFNFHGLSLKKAESSEHRYDSCRFPCVTSEFYFQIQ